MNQTEYIGNFLKWPGASSGLVGLLGLGWAGGAPLKPWGSQGQPRASHQMLQASPGLIELLIKCPRLIKLSIKCSGLNLILHFYYIILGLNYLYQLLFILLLFILYRNRVRNKAINYKKQSMKQSCLLQRIECGIKLPTIGNRAWNRAAYRREQSVKQSCRPQGIEHGIELPTVGNRVWNRAAYCREQSVEQSCRLQGIELRADLAAIQQLVGNRARNIARNQPVAYIAACRNRARNRARNRVRNRAANHREQS